MPAHRILRGTLCLVLAISVAELAPLARTARAALVTTEEALAPDAGRDRIRAFLERSEVREQLEALGVDPGEARGRVAGLSDGEVAAIAGKLDELPAAGNAAGFLLAVAALFFLLVFLDYVGVTDLFPFVNKQAQR